MLCLAELTEYIPLGICLKTTVCCGKYLGESPRVKGELLNYHSRLFTGKYLLNVCLSVCGMSGQYLVMLTNRLKEMPFFPIRTG